MNSLSWLIYLTQVVSAINNAGVFLISVGCIGLLIISFIGLLNVMFEENFSCLSKLKPYLKYPIYALILGGTLAIFAPNQRTMLLIVSSEVGERVINNPKVQGMVDPSMDLLKNWIANENQKVLKELSKDK